MKYLFHLVLIITPLLCRSQEIISTDGNSFSNSQGSLTFTIGEPVVETSIQANHILTQGFQQNYESILAIPALPFSSNISIYPNPFQNQVTILFQSVEQKEIKIQLTELNGKIIFDKIYTIATTNSLPIFLTDLPEGMYLLHLRSEEITSTTVRLIKSYGNHE